MRLLLCIFLDGKLNVLLHILRPLSIFLLLPPPPPSGVSLLTLTDFNIYRYPLVLTISHYYKILLVFNSLVFILFILFKSLSIVVYHIMYVYLCSHIKMFLNHTTPILPLGPEPLTRSCVGTGWGWVHF